MKDWTGFVIGIILFGSIITVVWWNQDIKGKNLHAGSRCRCKTCEAKRVMHERDLAELADQTGQIFVRPELDYKKYSDQDIAQVLTESAMRHELCYPGDKDPYKLANLLRAAADRLRGPRS